MTKDPIVEEVHHTREKILAHFGGDLHAYLSDVMKRQEQARAAGAKYVSLPPRRPNAASVAPLKP